MIYLYIKTHKITGLKYLGKTTKNPIEYIGSGKYWLRHLKKHGNDVETSVLFKCENEEIFRKISFGVSKILDVVESNNFANLMHEFGTGGDNSHNIDYERLSLLRKKNKNTWKLSETAKTNHSIAAKNMWNSEIGENLKRKRYEGSKKQIKDETYGPKLYGHAKNNYTNLTCPHCGKVSNVGNAKRWHFDNCKNYVETIGD